MGQRVQCQNWLSFITRNLKAYLHRYLGSPYYCLENTVSVLSEIHSSVLVQVQLILYSSAGMQEVFQQPLDGRGFPGGLTGFLSPGS